MTRVDPISSRSGWMLRIPLELSEKLSEAEAALLISYEFAWLGNSGKMQRTLMEHARSAAESIRNLSQAKRLASRDTFFTIASIPSVVVFRLLVECFRLAQKDFVLSELKRTFRLNGIDADADEIVRFSESVHSLEFKIRKNPEDSFSKLVLRPDEEEVRRVA